ncbi:hypothetical protein KR093_003617 [Drosophila rubida]|uniref:Protein hemingway n=1 Tax=Drosophila rubida TaxID=30044 RepID=A0AAD4JU56_9MUSC|nr:hypothetical protein KR093_003617 [Drosophila rubida]
MTAPPVNSDEDFYMDESFDEESLSEVEEEPEEDVQEEDSDSRSDSDVEAEFLRGNPHARRHQIFGKRSGGGSGFPREPLMQYNSSSEDEGQVVVRKTVAEVNQYKEPSDHTDDETLSDRTLVPTGNPGNNQFAELDEYEDMEMDEEDMDEDDEIVNELNDDLMSEHSNDDVEIGQFLDDKKPGETENSKLAKSDLVDVVDCESDEIGTCSDSDGEEKASPQNSDDEMDFMPMQTVQNKKPMSKTFPNLSRKPVVPAEVGKIVNAELPLPANIEDDALKADENDELDVGDCLGMDPSDTFNVKFLEQQMTQMSEMIMKTFRLSGGAADNNALEQLALATKLMKQQGKKLAELEDESESMSTLESPKTPTTVRSEGLSKRSSKCRCPSLSDDNEAAEDEETTEPFMTDECGQGDGLLRYPHMEQCQQGGRINCRVSSVTPTSFNSDNSGYHIDFRRPRSSTSSEKVNYKNLGRKSFSFTNPQVREIERQNHILLKKMMNVKPTIKPAVTTVKSNSNIPAKQPPAAPRLTSAAVNRKKYQRQIDLDNDVLKRKLEAVGSRRPIFK